MRSDALYTLAQSTSVEPLVGRWPAWPHVMAPVPQCLHLKNYQMKTLQSYLDNPDLHEKSCLNPRLRGGAFVDIPASEASKVKTLLETIEETQRDNIVFANALTEFHNQIVGQAKGDSLEGRYAEIPTPLLGYVELLYDYYNRPIVRCLEGLLYESNYYKRGLQSLHLFHQEHDGSRPYYMSTPRFADQNAIDWSVHFDNPRVDDLFRLDCEPQGFHHIREVVGLEPKDDGVLRQLLRETGPKSDARWQGPGIRIRYFGHACVLLETLDVSILIDPLVAGRPESSTIDRFSYDDLPNCIDYALITHGHHDHFVIETLLRLRHRIETLVVPKNSNVFYGDMSLRLLSQRLGFKNVREVDCLDELPISGGRIIAVPFLGEHNDLPTAKSAYLIQIGARSILFVADSNCLDAAMYEHVRQTTGPIEILFVGMECVGAPLSWVYGPILPIKSEHRHSQTRRSNGCNAVNALKLAQAVQCRRAFVYALGREPWLQYLLALNPIDEDVYVTESEIFIQRLKDENRGKGERLFGKAEIYL